MIKGAFMDWNNDGRIDGRDYAHYKSVINTGGNPSNSSYSDSRDRWIIAILIICLILKLFGCR